MEITGFQLTSASSRHKSKMPRNPELEQTVLYLGTCAYIMHHQRMIASLCRAIGNNGYMRQISRQALSDKVSRLIVCAVLGDRQAGAATFQEVFKIRHSSMINVAIRPL